MRVRVGGGGGGGAYAAAKGHVIIQADGPVCSRLHNYYVFALGHSEPQIRF